MSCAGCGRVNRAESRFCVGCGKPLAPRCPVCGAESEPEAQFCGACGAAFVAQPARAADKAEARKVVTIVFADLIGSTALHERLDPESVSRVMDRYHRAVRAPVEAHGGTVVQLLGDGVMCAFGVPHVAEDDAIRAVRAAVGIQHAFREFAREHHEVVGTTGLRVAVNTGEVVVSDDYAAGIGARARFDATGARDPLDALAKPNAATAATDRLQAAFEARDWAAMRAACAVDAKLEDRRRHVLVSLDVDRWIADLQRIAREAPDARFQRRLVGTAGERIDLERFLFRGGPGGDEYEIEYLRMAEVDDQGRIASAVVFDADDWRAANREAWARWFAADAAVAAVMGPIFESAKGWNDHDCARIRAVLADRVVVHDRRRAGMGLLEGADAYVDALPPLWELAPDVQAEPRFVLGREHYGSVSAGRIFGTFPEGGPFEGQLVWLFICRGGRITRLEIFEIEDVDAARARFAELGAEAAS
jgi:class 3 adenylate cyclase